MERKTIAVVGLGLIGGSLAMALRGFEDYQIVGVARRRETVDYANVHGVGDTATTEVKEVLSRADVTWLCLPPQGILDFLAAYLCDFKPGSLVTDVCGVKTAIVDGAKCLPPSVDFIGCHPMAGKEVSGIAHAEGSLFRNAHFIITPQPGNTTEHLELMKRMGEYMGFRDVVTATPEQHDAIIAYTSQVMHVMAAAVCDDPDLFDCKGFEGGSFRDCTRVAALDVPLWTELFSLNAPALCRVIQTLENNLHAYREAIECGDREALAAKLEHSASRKRQMNLEGPPRGDSYKPEG